jgi:hypothetical protein
VSDSSVIPGHQKVITPKAMAAAPRSNSSHQFSASRLKSADATGDMLDPD